VASTEKPSLALWKKGDPDSDEWNTPGWLCELLGDFDLDPCSNDRSLVRAAKRYTLAAGNDGLLDPWEGSVFCNPPYSDPLPWCKRLAGYPGPWCALVKLDPSTRWWSELITASTGHAAFRHRIKFDRPDKQPLSANFPSALVWHLWKPTRALAAHLWIKSYAMDGAA
jgi:hypothetical protein